MSAAEDLGGLLVRELLDGRIEQARFLVTQPIPGGKLENRRSAAPIALQNRKNSPQYVAVRGFRNGDGTASTQFESPLRVEESRDHCHRWLGCV